MATNKNLEGATKAHAKASKEAFAKGASPRDATIAGLVAEMMFHNKQGR